MTPTMCYGRSQAMAARLTRATWLVVRRRETKLDTALQELERAEKVKLTEIKGKRKQFWMVYLNDKL
jgi:hypothetical protein